MPSVTNSGSSEDLDGVLRARDDVLVAEQAIDEPPVGDLPLATRTQRFGAAHGPYERYERTVVSAPSGYEEHISFRLAIPYFRFLFTPLMKRSLRRDRSLLRAGRAPWWAPPDRLDARAATVMAVLAAIAMIAGYLNTLLSQTIAFAADDFGANDSAQGVALAVVRAGVVISFVVVAAADKRGRRKIMLGTTIAAPVVAAVGAFAPSLAWLTATQTIARPLALAMLILVGVIAAEEMPAGSRAYAASILTMATAFGAFLCLVALPLADTGRSGWRGVYVVPVLALLAVPDLARRLPETRRYERAERLHRAATLASHRARFWLLAISALLSSLLIAPASSFQNRYLKRERHFSALKISIYSTVTNTPGGIGVLVGGRLADIRGRRSVGAFALAFGSIFTVFTFFLGGWTLWVSSTVGTIVGAAAIPALGVYGPELFPTSLRGKANGAITVFSLIGSAIGLVVAGTVADRMGRFGPVMALLCIGPLLHALLIRVAYPETARVELEALNPEDA